jgi:hypothetical protein
MSDIVPDLPAPKAARPPMSGIVMGVMFGGVVAANGVGVSSNFRVEAVEKRMDRLEQLDRDQERAAAEQVLVIRDMMAEIRIAVQELRGMVDSTRVIVERMEKARR